MTVAAYALVIAVRVRLNPQLPPPVVEHVPLAEKVAALGRTAPTLAIILGLFAGLFTPTEAGAIGAFLRCVVAAVEGRLSLDAVRRAAVETIVTTSSILVVAGGPGSSRPIW